MNEKQFLRTASRVREILSLDEYSREDDIYLTWQYWKLIDPGLEELSMREFKSLFLGGYFGLPASITRARALIQNKTNPELRGIVSDKIRRDRGRTWSTWFAKYFGGRPVTLSPDLQVIANNLEELTIIKEKPVDQEAIDQLRERCLSIVKKFDVQPQKIDDMKQKKFNSKKQPELYSLGDYLRAFKPEINPSIEDAAIIREEAKKINKERGIPYETRQGSGAREGIALPLFQADVLAEAIKRFKASKNG